MAEIASWNGHSFTVSPKLIRGFTGLTIKGSSETEDKTSGGQKYVSCKNSNPSEITLTAELNALTGCDVKNEALKFVDEARSGAKNYFYMGGKKLITWSAHAHGGVCERNNDCPQWHMDQLQSEADDEAVREVRRIEQFFFLVLLVQRSGSSSGSKKTSTKKTSTTTTKKTTTSTVASVVSKVVNTVKTVATAVKAATTGAEGCERAENSRCSQDQQCQENIFHHEENLRRVEGYKRRQEQDQST